MANSSVSKDFMFKMFHQDGFLSASVPTYSNVCFAWQRSLKSYDHVWPNIRGKRRLDDRGASEYSVWLATVTGQCQRTCMDQAATLLENTHTHTHIHNLLCQPLSFGSFFSHRQVTSSFNFAPKPLSTDIVCPNRTHPACFENVQECMREDAVGEKKKVRPTREPERSQEQQPIPERFPWRQVWQRTMRGERE